MYCVLKCIPMRCSRSQYYISESLVAGDLGIPMVVNPFVFTFISIDAGPLVQSVSTASVTVTAMLNGIEI